MKVLKYVLFFIGGLFALILLVALFVPKTYRIERSVVIQAPRELVMQQATDFRNANQWNPWVEEDPEIQITYGGEPGQVGHTSSWTSSKVGSGTQIITGVTADRLDSRLEFREPFEGTAEACFLTSMEGNAVKATWSMKGEDPYPKNIMILFMDNMVGGAYEKGLNKLKTRCEELANGNASVN